MTCWPTTLVRYVWATPMSVETTARAIIRPTSLASTAMSGPPSARRPRSNTCFDRIGVVTPRQDATSTPRRVELRQAGAALLEEARALLEQLDGVVERVRQAARQDSGRLVAGFLGSTAHWLAPEIARAWHERRPGVGLEVEEIALDEQLL